jgi:phage FluMu gp28-like protein
MSQIAASIDYFLPYQKAWIDEAAPMALGEKSRRIGWTYASSFRAVQRRVEGKCNLYFSSADYTAGREFIDYCRTWCEVFNAVATFSEGDETVPEMDEAGKVIDERKIHTMNLTFANGTKIVAGSSNPTFFRSKGGDADGDEFAFHRAGRELAKAMHATALFWGHQLRLWSTHNTDASVFNRMIQDARAGKLKASVHRVTILDAVEQGIVEKIKKLKARDDKARREWLDELRSTCDQATWDEEYLCIPSAEGGAFLPFDTIRRCAESNLQLLEDPAQLKGVCYAGYDVGRSHDLSVLWVNELVGDVAWTRMALRLKGRSFAEQRELLNRVLANPAVKRLCIDKGLIGLQLAEELADRWGPHRAEGVQLAPGVQGEAAGLVLGSMEDRRIRLPDDEAIRTALHKPRKVMVGGNVRVETPRDEAGHCDEFWALCLARLAQQEAGRPLPAPLMEKPLGW